MARSFKEAIQHRRTHYGIGNNSPISDNEIHEIIKTAVTHVPSAFNSQSTRIVLLQGESHKKLWEIVKDTLRKIVPAEAYKATEAKIDNSFEAGYGTVLFFEDTAVEKAYRSNFLLIKRISRYGPNRHRLCINSRYGLCWKTPASALLCNITTR